MAWLYWRYQYQDQQLCQFYTSWYWHFHLANSGSESSDYQSQRSLLIRDKIGSAYRRHSGDLHSYKTSTRSSWTSMRRGSSLQVHALREQMHTHVQICTSRPSARICIIQSSPSIYRQVRKLVPPRSYSSITIEHLKGLATDFEQCWFVMGRTPWQ